MTRNAGLAVILGSFALTGLLIIAWLAGLVFGVGGSLIHLLLIFAIFIVPAGLVAGAVVMLIARRKQAPPQ